MSLELFGDKAEEESTVPLIESPTDMRPDLSEYGIVEHDRGICEDTYENRSLLRQSGFQWVPVYTETGNATGLIEARSLEQMKERRLLSLQGKRALLADPLSNNSEYLTGLDLIVDSEACKVVPPWVLAATRAYVKEQEAGGPPTAKRAPKPMPTRCREFTSEGIRCMLWASGNIKDDGLCRMHLGKNRKTGADIERARAKLMQSAPYAVDTLEQLMETAVSEPVKLKAATEILDRAGVRAGMDIGIDVDIKDSRSPAQIIAERLARLKNGAAMIETQFADTNVQDAEVVIETPEIFTPQPEPEDTISAEELEELQ
jgi:hypothetical protein